jgi:hypothetical protein
VATEVGKTYVAQAEVSAVSSSPVGAWELRVGTSDYPPNLHDGTLQTSAGKYVATFTATTTTTFIVLKTHGTTGGTQTVSWDNVSVRLAEADRSVNNNGLQVHGTVTKSAVATGAELVAYSGFSSSNYLEQPYNSDLNLNEFSVTIWFKTWSSSRQIMIFRGKQQSGAVPYWAVEVGSGCIALVATNSSNSGQFLITSGVGKNIADNNWHQLTLTKQGTLFKTYVDGVYNSTATATTHDFSQANEQVVGVGGNAHGLPSSMFAGNIALARISATVPTAEQIAKMYRDEKPLFQENAKATLYGTSDSVTALAYDDDTELLHAGTSAGRSVFKGLQRVSNTTDAVGTAISASNDLVVEE